MDKKKIHALLAKRLYGLLYSTNPSFFSNNNKSFLILFEKELDILACLEKTEGKKNDLGTKFLAKSLVQKYNSLTKNNFVLSKKKINLEDFIDDINYLPVFCKNIFKVNIDDIVDKVLFNKSNETFKNSQTNIQQEKTNFSSSSFGSNQEFKNVFNKSYIHGLATSKAMKDFALGKVYIYKTKPRIILILKMILLVLIILTGLVSLLISITSFIIVWSSYENDWDFLWKSLSHLIYFIICVNIAINLINQFKKKNLNKKYFFSWSVVLPYFFSVFFIVIFNFTNILFFLNFDWYALSISDHFQYICYMIIYYSNNIFLALLLATIASCIVAFIYNPKKDESIIQNTIDKYVDEISKTQSPYGS